MKSWFITGASRGLGRAVAEAALERGDRVAAGVRVPEDVDDLVARYGDRMLAVSLDVADPRDVRTAVDEAHAAFGRLDVVVNNAAFGVIGAVEEVSEAEVREIFDTNLFGALWVTQAVLPLLREQGGGHIVQASSVAGVVAFPMISLYCASKAALEALSLSLAQEVAEQGIKVTLLEPGAMRTDWAQRSMRRAAAPIEAYRDAWAARLAAMDDEYRGASPGDPRRAAAELLQIVDADDPPLRVLMGSGAYDVAVDGYARALEQWAQWEDVARSTDFPAATTAPTT